jgi:hypothetical protein
LNSRFVEHLNFCLDELKKKDKIILELQNEIGSLKKGLDAMNKRFDDITVNSKLVKSPPLPFISVSSKSAFTLSSPGQYHKYVRISGDEKIDGKSDDLLSGGCCSTSAPTSVLDNVLKVDESRS